MRSKTVKNSDNAFAASLSFGFGNEKQASYSLGKEDLSISKYAGLDIYQPTIENTEMFIRKYVLNELSFYPKILDVSIDLIPSSFDSVKKEYVRDATGLVKVRIHEKTLEIPFMLRDGEMLPFDVIQMDNQRVPYSRENLRKVLIGMDNIQRNKAQVGSNSPYLKLDKTTNPATSPGFLGDVLRIQDQHIRHAGNGGTEVYACNKIEATLEKIANAKPLTMESVKNLQTQFYKKAKEQISSEYEKLAEEAALPDNEENLKLFQRAKDAQFVDANSLPNGTVISFPEKIGRDLEMTKGMVISDYMDFAGESFRNIKVVITNDSRMRVLSSSERFLCFKSKEQLFDIPQRSVSGLSEGDIIMAFDGNKALTPCVVRHIKRRFYSGDHDIRPDGETENALKVYELEPLPNNDRLSSLFTDTGKNEVFHNKELRVNLNTLKDAKFLEVPYGDFISRKALDIGIDEITLSSMLNREEICIRKYTKKRRYNDGITTNLVFCTDETTKVIPIKGVIRNFLRDRAEFTQMENTANFDLTDEEGFDKVAYGEDSIRIECIDRRMKLFKVAIRYTDKSKKMFKQMAKNFDRIPEEKVREILRALSFFPMNIQEILFKAKNEQYAQYPLPRDADMSKLEGGAATNMSIQNIKNTVGRFLSPQDLTNAVITGMVGSMIGAGIKGGSAQQLSASAPLRGFLKKISSEAKSLSVEFEKVAIEHNSRDAQDVARLMALNSIFAEKVASTATGEDVYLIINEVAKDILDDENHLSKIASELMSLKAQQYENRVGIISPSCIQSAINSIDNLYKLASAVDSANPMNKEAGAAELMGKAVNFATKNPKLEIAGAATVGAGVVGLGALAKGIKNKNTPADPLNVKSVSSDTNPIKKEAGMADLAGDAADLVMKNPIKSTIGAIGVGALANHIGHKSIQKDMSKGISSGLLDAQHQREDEIQGRIKDANAVKIAAESTLDTTPIAKTTVNAKANKDAVVSTVKVDNADDQNSDGGAVTVKSASEDIDFLFKNASDDSKKKISKTMVCNQCGKERDNQTQEDCTCSGKQVVPKEDFENSIKPINKEASFGFGFHKHGFNSKNYVSPPQLCYASEEIDELVKEAGLKQKVITFAKDVSGKTLSKARSKMNTGELKDIGLDVIDGFDTDKTDDILKRFKGNRMQRIVDAKKATNKARLQLGAGVVGAGTLAGTTYAVKKHNEKTAGFGGAIARTTLGTAVGAGIGLDAVNKQNTANPGSTDPDSDLTGVVGKGILGGVGLGVGGHYAKKGFVGAKKLMGIADKVASNEIDSLFEKASAMEVPTEEEKKKENNEVSTADKKKIVTDDDTELA